MGSQVCGQHVEKTCRKQLVGNSGQKTGRSRRFIIGCKIDEYLSNIDGNNPSKNQVLKIRFNANW